MVLITEQTVTTDYDPNLLTEAVDSELEGSTNIYYTLIDELMKCSIAAHSYIDHKVYMTMDDEDITSEKITYALLQIVLDELKEVGIQVIADEDDFNHIPLLRMIMLIRYVIDPPNINIMLNEHENDYNSIQDLINTGDQDSIKQYLIYLSEHDLIKLLQLKSVFMTLDVDNLTDKFVNNNRFLDHIEEVLKLIHCTPEEVLYTSDEYYPVVVKEVEQDRHDFFIAIDKLKEHGVHVKLKDRDYDLDKLGHRYPYWVWCLDSNKLTDIQRQMQDSYKNLHHISNDHHVEYYLQKLQEDDISLTESDLAKLVCHHYHPNMSRDTMREAMSHMLDLGIGLFSDENKHHMQKLATILMDGHK
jgi:hypothetical protein